MKKMLEKPEELALARAWLDQQCERSRARLVDAYHPMIRRIARKHLRNGLTMDDLTQEGVIGFMAALDNFDPDRGYSVGTLARFHIAARVQLYVSEFTGIIRLPNSRRIKGLLSNCVSKIRFEENLRGETLSAAEKDEICTNAGFSLRELEQYEMVMRPTKSLAAQSSSDDDETVFELADETADVEAEVVRSSSMKSAEVLLGRILADFPERTRTILRMRHLSEDFVSLDKIAAEVGVSRERVRRIEMDALDVIRERFKAAGIDGLGDIA
jgi:RNA polymerase sigma factor (sigma-70 family)|tara:strand:+ start:857 stop:1666 length:810 start_codon:yes stop_codon:yes gene_type:complete